MHTFSNGLVMEIVLNKIIEFRRKKGFSHEYMAYALNMSQPAYSKIEKNETKLSVDRLFEIAKILEVTVLELLDIDARNTYNQDLKDNAVGHQELNDNAVAHQQIENQYQDNKQLFEKIELLYESRLHDKEVLLSHKTNQIAELHDRLAVLKKRYGTG